MIRMLNDKIAKMIFECYENIRGEHISEKLQELMRNQKMTEEQLDELRITKLKTLAEHAFNYSPLYRKRFEESGISKIRNFEDLKCIKPVSKEELRKNIGFIVSAKPISKLSKAKTSGSTGIPLVFPKDSISRAYHYAAMYRGHSWYGLEIGNREARLWGVPVDLKSRLKVKIFDYFLNRFREKDYKLSEEILNDFHRRVETSCPKYIMGYGKMLYEFAAFLKQNDKNLSHLRLKMAKYTTENLNDDEIDLIRDTFCCPVASEYGAAETGIISFQCPKGGHHIASDCIYIEYMDVEEQNLGLKEIVITDLNNMSFPIIRYRLGDLVSPSEKACSCGISLPLLEKVRGRTSEIFTLDGKQKFHSIIFYYIMKKLSGDIDELLQFRVLQKSPKKFCYQLACKKEREKVDKLLVDLTKNELGKDVEIQVQYLDYLPREPSGKLRDFISYNNGYQ